MRRVVLPPKSCWMANVRCLAPSARTDWRGVAVLPDPFQNVNRRFCVFCRYDADGDGDILMGGVHYAHHGDKEIV